MPVSGGQRKVIFGQSGGSFGHCARQGQSTQRIRLRRIYSAARSIGDGRGDVVDKMRATLEFAGLAHLKRVPDLLRRSVIPASKRVAKIRRLAEAESMGD